MGNSVGTSLSRLTVAAALIFSMLIGACIPAPATAPEQLIEQSRGLPCEGAPLQIDEGYALVPVYLSGYDQALLFLLDTGAGRTLLTPETRRVADIERTELEDSILIGATGEEQHTSYLLDSLRVGNITQHNIVVTELDLYRFHRSDVRYAGVLGNDFLRRNNVEYNLPERRICFYDPPDDPEHLSLESFKRVPFYRQIGESGFVTFEIDIGGESAEALFDTGSSHTIFNTQAALLDGALMEQLPIRSETYGIGIGEATETRLYTFSDLRARDVEFQPQQISIADLPIFEVLRRRNRPFILMGNDLIRPRIVYIRYSSRELFFSDPISNP